MKAAETPGKPVKFDFPFRYLMTTGEFLKYMNQGIFSQASELGEVKPMTRRTLQYYSSPQVKLLPLPVYRNRHTAHHIVPDHSRLLNAIWILRERHNLSIDAIREILEDLPESEIDHISSWRGSGSELISLVPLLKAGFNHEDLDCFEAFRILADRGKWQKAVMQGEGGKATSEALRRVAKEGFSKVEKWLGSGRGARFLKELMPKGDIVLNVGDLRIGIK